MPKKSKESSIGCCTYFLSAIVVALASVVGRYAYKQGMPAFYHKAKVPEHIEILDVDDSTRLKHVLFSGEPWLLQCYSGLPYDGQHLPKPFRLDPSFVESLDGSLRGLVKAGTLDCEKMLGSNKTLITKFGFVRRTQPLLIYAGGGDRPKQIPAASTGSAYGITAFVKPKAEPRVKTASNQKTLETLCGGRRPCLLSRLEKDSSVLESIARKFRTVEVVALGAESVSKIEWGRGAEVGETLEPEEEAFFGKRTSMLRLDPEAPKPTRKNPKPAPRLLRAFDGAEDTPSLSKFVEEALAAAPDESYFLKSPIPALTVTAKPKKEKKEKKAPKQVDPKEEAARQAKRAAARAAAKAKDEELRAAAEAKRKELTEEQRQAREQARRQEMAEEEAAATNMFEDADDDDDDDDDEEVEVEEEDDGTDVMDLDA